MVLPFQSYLCVGPLKASSICYGLKQSARFCYGTWDFFGLAHDFSFKYVVLMYRKCAKLSTNGLLPPIQVFFKYLLNKIQTFSLGHHSRSNSPRLLKCSLHGNGSATCTFAFVGGRAGKPMLYICRHGDKKWGPNTYLMILVHLKTSSRCSNKPFRACIMFSCVLFLYIMLYKIQIWECS